MRLFLSHATNDARLVDQIRRQLARSDVSVYLAEYDGRAGENVHAKIAKEIDRCDVMLVLLTKAAHASTYVHQEIGYGKRAGKLIIPVVSAEVRNADLGMLQGTEYIVIDEDAPTDALLNLGQRIDRAVRESRRRDAIEIGALVGIVAIVIFANLEK